MTVAVFVVADWRVRFPEFSNVSDDEVNDCFTDATMILDNTDASLAPCDPATYLPRLRYLWHLTAHLAQLYFGSTVQAQSRVVGRISSAGQGSVNMSAEYNGPQAASWYNQTQYGATYWNMTRQLRTFQYVPGMSGPACPPRRW